MARAKILVVDDEPIKRSVLEDELRAAGYEVATASNSLEAQPYLKNAYFDVVLTDLRMPGQDGLSFLRDLKSRRPDQAVMIMTAYGTVETAVEAMKLGAFDYLQKPFSTEELLIKVDKILAYTHLASENEALRRQLAIQQTEQRIVGQSEAVRNVLSLVHAVAATDATVLIEGESGTGKELVAQTVHAASPRASGPFVAVACAALPRDLVETELFGHEAGAFTGATKRRIGRFELAHDGTLFLDDVDDVPPDIQVKLLRVLQNRTFERVGGEQPVRTNVRVIAATKKILAVMVEKGEFREDLYYRLNVVPIRIPLLRDRPEDIPLLIEHFLERSAVKMNRGHLKISPGAVARLMAHEWPGNVRELEHVIERMTALSFKEVLDVQDVPEFPPARASKSRVTLMLDGADRIPMTDVLVDVETRLIRWALDRAGGNLAKAAELLGVPRSTLQYKISKVSSDVG